MQQSILRRHDIQQNVTQHNDTHYNNKWNATLSTARQKNGTRYRVLFMLSVMYAVILLCVIYAVIMLSIMYVGILCFESEVFNFLFSNFSFK